MSKIAEFRAAEKALAEQLAHLESLKKDAALQQEIQFEEKLRELMGAYGKSLRDVVAILDPASARGAVARATGTGRAKRRLRVVKVYKNPHTGEVVETKGGNQKTLKAWKAQYGSDVVESWLQG